MVVRGVKSAGRGTALAPTAGPDLLNPWVLRSLVLNLFYKPNAQGLVKGCGV